MARPSKPAVDNDKVVASNRQARRNYEILDTVEAGIVLRGSEVKSMRESKVQIAEAFGRIDDHGEVWLHGMHVAHYSHSGVADTHPNERQRKLLLSVYFKGGRVKVELGLGRGRKSYDKRQVIATRDADREAARAMSHRHRASG